MTINLDKEKQCLHIEDEVKFQYNLVRFILFLSLFQMSILLFSQPVAARDFVSWIMILIAFISIVFFIYLYKLSTKKKIHFSEIESLVIKNFLGRKQLILKLKNGKTRNLNIKSIKQIEELKQSLEQELSNIS